MKATIHNCYWLNKPIMAEISTEEVDLPEKDRLKYLQKIVDGLIEVVSVEIDGVMKDLIVNEEGLLIDLPMNPWAQGKGLSLAGTVIEIHGQLD